MRPGGRKIFVTSRQEVVMKRTVVLLLALMSLVVPAQLAFAQLPFFSVVPFEFDPFDTRLVAAEWRSGIGCPTNAKTAPFLPPYFTTVGSGTYTDPACPSGDPLDDHNQGLLLAKTGPTNNDASAGATLDGVHGTILSELGYDLRKPGATFADPRGSHCGAGAPRFNVFIGSQLWFIGCASPPPNVDTPGNGWQRLRWGGSNVTDMLLAFNSDPTSPCNQVPCDIRGMIVDCIEIVFDEGDDTGPDNFGLAVVDNINVNGTRVGRGP